MEVYSLILTKLIEWLILTLFANYFYKLPLNTRSFLKSSSSLHPFETLTQTHVEKFTLTATTKPNTIVCDINDALLKPSSSSFFPFFMLFAFEGGGVFRAFLLLLSYPFCCLFSNHVVKLRIMTFITFCGMKVEIVESVGKTVLPKFYLEEINPLVYEMWNSAKGRVVISSVPRVMVDWFAREYLGATKVLANELHTISINGGLLFSGLSATSSSSCGLVGDTKFDVGVGIHEQFLVSLCKEAYVVPKDTNIPSLPRNKYPKPLIFHDGRLAFLPTPTASLSMFVYLPVALVLFLLRFLASTLLPFPISTLLCALSGMRLVYSTCHTWIDPNINHHVLYVSNHRTLLDPVFLRFALRKPLSAVTYSLSRVSELIAPIPTVRLTRDRARDAATMQRLLSKGDLVVCPEGTTCREPYLLRFSSLFAELTDEIVPVAVEADVSMFYGTTASGFKWLDPVFFLMNPSPSYSVKVLEKVPSEKTCGGGGRNAVEVANYVQKEVATTLGFECTGFTRKDKYLMLAGNDGFVDSSSAR